MTTISRPKLMILGHARHGKDTVGEWFVKRGYTFVSSSWFVCEKAVFPAMMRANAKNYGLSQFPYANAREAFEDRANHRGFWYRAISDYNRPDAARLGKELFAEYDMYVGLRSARELHALRNAGAFDIAVWVDASERCPQEPRSSCTVEPWMADYVIDNNGTLEDLDFGLEVLYNKRIKPLEKAGRPFPSGFKVHPDDEHKLNSPSPGQHIRMVPE